MYKTFEFSGLYFIFSYVNTEIVDNKYVFL